MKRYWWIPLAIVLWVPFHAIHSESQQGSQVEAEGKEEPDPIFAFNEFLAKRDLGKLQEGIWIFHPPSTRPREDELGNLAYGLEWYKIYAERIGKTAGELGRDLGLRVFAYDSLKIPRDDLVIYFGSNSLQQVEILRRHLRPHEEHVM